MSRWFGGVVVVAGLWAGGCVVPHPGPVPVDEAAAPVRVVGQPVSGPVTWISVAVRAGSAHDPVGKEGLAALTAKLLREGGAGDRTPEAVDTLLYRLGTDVEVVVGKELVTFRTRVLTDDLPAVTTLLADMVRAPGLDAAVLARLKDEAVDGLEPGLLEDDEALGMEILDNLLYDGHPYGHPVSGRTGVVPTFTKDDVRGFLAEHYTRSSVVLGVAGAAVSDDGQWDSLQPGAADLGALHTALSGLPATIYDAPTPKRVAPVDGRRLVVVETATGSTGVHFGHPTALHRGHPDWPAMLLAVTALGEHRQSHGRLYRSLRKARGLNYGDYAYIERYVQDGWSSHQEWGTGRRDNPFYVWLRPTAAEDGPFALRAATELVEDFAAQGLDGAELERIQTYLAARVALWAADPGRRLGWAVEAEAMGWPDPIDTLPERVAALTQDDVQQAISEHLDPDNMAYVVVTGDADAFIDRVRDGVASPRAAADADPAVAAQDAAWSTADVGWSDITTVSGTGRFR